MYYKIWQATPFLELNKSYNIKTNSFSMPNFKLFTQTTNNHFTYLCSHRPRTEQNSTFK